MSRIIPISWKKFEKFLLYVGCYFKRERGDHRIYWRIGISRPLVIPKDSQIPVFIIRNNIRLLNISPDEYIEIINRV